MKRLNKSRLFHILTDITLAVAVLLVYSATIIPQSQLAFKRTDAPSPIYSGNRDKACVSLMFNVYQNTDCVNGIMDALGEHGVKCTFFVGGCWADDNAETLARMVSEGHEIGNHGYFHKDHKSLGYESNKQEIINASKVVKALCGYEITLFAPPSGSFGKNTLKACEELGYKVIMWSKDTIDWRDKDADVVLRRATDGIKNGDLVLMHPTEHTLSALGKVLSYYEENNLKAVTVSENIS